MGHSQSIYQAAEHGRLRRLQMWTKRYPRSSLRVLINLHSTDGQTPLTVASRGGHVDVVEYLIDVCGAATDLTSPTDDDGRAQPLWWATNHQRLNVVRSLVTRGANVNSNANLIEACIWGNFDIARYLVASGADIEAKSNGRTALHWACKRGHYQIACYLIRNGANGASALKYCVTCYNLRFVRLLLRYGAKVERMLFEMRPLLLIRTFDNSPILEILMCLPFVPRYPLEFLRSLGVSCVDVSRFEPYDLPQVRWRVEMDRVSGHWTRTARANEWDDERWVDALQLTLSTTAAGPAAAAADHHHAKTVRCYLCWEKNYYWQQLETSVSLWDLLAATQRYYAPPLAQVTIRYILLVTTMFLKFFTDNHPPNYQLVLAVFGITVKEIGVEMRRPRVQRDLYQFRSVMVAAIRLAFCLLHVKPHMPDEHVSLFYRFAYEFIRLDPRDYRNCTPLHLMCSRADQDFAPLLPDSIIEAFEFVLEVGADASAVDDQKNSPLHCVAGLAPVRHDVIALLLKSGAHFDAMNKDRKCFTQLLPQSERYKYRLGNRLSLKCLAAITIADHAVPCESINGNPPLIQFVSLH